METLKLSNQNGVLTVELNRPDVRNAFNEVLIGELLETFEKVGSDKSVRVIVLRGSGKLFCAGGDLNWMKKSKELTGEANYNDTRRLTKMFDTMNSCPKPIVGLIHGAAIGGGVGLVSVCDYVIASAETTFSLSEVRLGIIPACIGPFVLAKIGESHARSLFISAERFTAQRALEVGLVHELVESHEALDVAYSRITKNMLECGPNAQAAVKKLISGMKQKKTHAEALEFVACMLADLRVTPEGQEGLSAFLEKRKPNWIKE